MEGIWLGGKEEIDGAGRDEGRIPYGRQIRLYYQVVEVRRRRNVIDR
jgi:hypothetical protein